LIRNSYRWSLVALLRVPLVSSGVHTCFLNLKPQICEMLLTKGFHETTSMLRRFVVLFDSQFNASPGIGANLFVHAI
jgi:hypothetical protein